jgi:ABC-type amino acid transport substrate-binding protein
LAEPFVAFPTAGAPATAAAAGTLDATAADSPALARAAKAASGDCATEIGAGASFLASVGSTTK